MVERDGGRPDGGRDLGTVAIVKLLRRALLALGMGAVLASGIRLRGRGGTPPQHGGWQPVDLADK
ncbi:hypothetical protein BH24ACT5_BH24ACT5_01130 [soil metagenome]